MSKNSVNARMEALKGWLDQTRKAAKYGSKVKRIDNDVKETPDNGASVIMARNKGKRK
jgi:hypothetical protein